MTGSPIRLLLVEDNITDALLLRESIAESKGAEFVVRHVTTLTHCLTALSEEIFDAVLIDLGLPDSHGIDTFLKLRQCAAAEVVIVLTGLDDEEMGMKAVQMGAQDYLMKGQMPGALLGRIIRYAIERNSLRKKLDERRNQEAHDRELYSVAKLAGTKTQVTAAMYSSAMLRESVPDSYAKCIREYSRLLDVSMDLRIYKTERTLSESLQDLGNELGLLRASPRDVIEIHTAVLKEKIKGLPLPKMEALLEEGRLTILELMGYLASFYRGFYAPPQRKAIGQ